MGVFISQSRFLINESGERFAAITHVQWFLPKTIQGNKINVQGDTTVVWLKPVIEGTYPVLCKIQDSAARIHYKAMYLTSGERVDGGAGGECQIKSEATHKEPE
ncbi:hypothetical protein MNBD_GAMMA11-798 [hydrothermal vent metagenome]|uniref:Uncharacterized protein n=1 Tax=hydrothermal vent metagenome TaxID=652676 RepID=A0A3B0XDA1_9ZZZZ